MITKDAQIGSKVSLQPSEAVPLLKSPSGNHWWERVCRRFRVTSMCVTSKAALLTLFWSVSISILYELSSNPGRLYYPVLRIEFISLVYILNAISLCFYPLAGYLADNVTGRYKAIIRSLQILLFAVIVAALPIAIFIALYCTANFNMLNSIKKQDYQNFDSWGKVSLVGLIGMFIVSVLFYIAMNVSFVGFNANIIQFGMEQLHDSPLDHQSLYIYWFVWIYYLVQILIMQPWSFSFNISVIITLSLILFVGSFVMVAVSTCVANRKKTWFLINPARINPYELVNRITRFARHHKVPIRRSAFTYCEDEIPTGLDLAKTKYGGLYTTEEVENVKEFYGIIKILLSLGPVFFFSYASDSALFWYTRKGFLYEGNNFNTALNYSLISSSDATSFTQNYFIASNFISSLAGIVLIPLYVFAAKPLRCYVSFSMLKRIGLGIMFQILTLISITAFISSFEHLRNNCMFQSWFKTSNFTEEMTIREFEASLPVLSHLFYGIANVLHYTALCEFICALSPPSMKGLLIGLSFAIKGVFQAIGAAFVIPFSFIPRCGLWYYGTNAILAIIALMIYIIIARKYKYRQRDEICDVYRYAEEYYSCTQEEQNYD